MINTHKNALFQSFLVSTFDEQLAYPYSKYTLVRISIPQGFVHRRKKISLHPTSCDGFAIYKALTCDKKVLRRKRERDRWA